MEGIDLYICPECHEEYEVFEDVMGCYKSHYDEKKNDKE